MAERRPLERRRDAVLVEAVPALVHRREDRRDVVLLVARRQADVLRAGAGRERVHGQVEPGERLVEAEAPDDVQRVRRAARRSATGRTGTRRRRRPSRSRRSAARAPPSGRRRPPAPRPSSSPARSRRGGRRTARRSPRSTRCSGASARPRARGGGGRARSRSPRAPSPRRRAPRRPRRSSRRRARPGRGAACRSRGGSCGSATRRRSRSRAAARSSARSSRSTPISSETNFSCAIRSSVVSCCAADGAAAGRHHHGLVPEEHLQGPAQVVDLGQAGLQLVETLFHRLSSARSRLTLAVSRGILTLRLRVSGRTGFSVRGW